MAHDPDNSLGSLVEEFDAERNQRAPAVGGSNRKNVILIAIAAFAVLAAGVILTRQLVGGGADPGARSRERDLICAETGEVFERFRVADGSVQPWKNPRTGRDTLYPAEACYWNPDGTVKLKPTYVLLNEHVGKEGPTLCPDCGRRVVGHNPMPPVDLMSQALEREKR